jgi:rRNA biogenesis protein RRP5
VCGRNTTAQYQKIQDTLRVAMSSTKRKIQPSNESFMRSKRSTENDGPPSKRLRKEDSLKHTRAENRNSKDIGSGNVQLSKIAAGKGEEAAFPRGGASILTPLEHKQIHIEAERDVLFEQQSISRRQDARDEETIELQAFSKTAKKRKSRLKGQEGPSKLEDGDELVKIEGLSYKVFPLSRELYKNS